MELRERVVAIAVTIGFLFTFVSGALAQGTDTEPVRLLVIDETHSIRSSLQIAQFARMLNETAQFNIDAMTNVPMKGNAHDQAYDLAVIVPPTPAQVWIVTSDIPERLPSTLQEAVHLLKTVAKNAYEEEHALDAREVVDVTDDLFPAIYGGFLAQNGWLE